MSKHINKYIYVQNSHGLMELSNRVSMEGIVEEGKKEFYNGEVRRWRWNVLKGLYNGLIMKG